MDPLDFDPLAQLDRDPFAALDRALGLEPQRKRRRAPKYPAISPDEETSLVDEILSKGANALQYVGETLDKPGRAVRGLIGGGLDTLDGKADPNWGGGLLNLVPFSDAMGLTDPKTAVEGRDLLTKLGAPENKEGFFNDPLDSALDVGGLATEILLDPLTYTGVGLLTKGGKTAARATTEAAKLAAKAGHLIPNVADNLASQVAKGHRSLLSFGLGDNVLEWTGPGSASWVAEAIDPAWEAVRKSRPGRLATRLFSPSAMNMQSEIGQELARKHHGILDDLQAEALQPIYTDYANLRKAGLTSQEGADVFRQSLEGVPLDPARVAALTDSQAAIDAGLRSRARQAPMITEMRDVGVNADHLDDVVNYGARYHYADVPGVMAEFGNAVRGKPKLFDPARAEDLKRFAGGTTEVNDLVNGIARDPASGRSVWSMTQDEAVPWLSSLYQGVPPEETAGLAEKLYNRIHALDRARYDVAIAGPNAKRLYNAHGTVDEAQRTARHVKRKRYVDMAHEMAASAARSEDDLIREFGGVPAGAVELKQALDSIDINFQGKGLERTTGYMNQLGVDPVTGGKRFIMPEHLADMKRLAKIWQTPEELQGVARMYDAFQNVWKTFMTAVWPSFHTRNIIGGLGYHWMSGHANNPLGAATPFAEAYRLMSGQDVSDRTLDILRKSSPELANIRNSQDLLGAVLGHQFVRPGGSFYADMSTPASEQIARAMSGGVPATPPTSVLDNFKSIVTDNYAKGKEAYRKSVTPTGGPFQDVPDLVDPATGQIISGLKPLARSNTARKNRFSKLVGWGVPEDQAARMTRRRFGDPDPATLLSTPDGMILGTKWQTEADNVTRLAHYEGLVKGGMPPEDAAMETRRYFKDPLDTPPTPASLQPPGRVGKAVRAVSATADAAAGVGRDVGEMAESMLRVGHGLAALANGATLSEARQSIAKWFFNYDEMTQFDKQVMRRLFPFWGWAKNNSPLVFQELIQNPGGRMAQSIRAVGEGRPSTGYVPEWIGGGNTVIPVTAGNKDGRYITSLGLPFESALDWSISPTPYRTTQRNLERVVSSMSPVFKFGYSMASGRDPYSGRELRDLYPFPLPADWNATNAALANSPASRAISFGRKTVDDRKSWGDLGLDFLTGVKVTDVSGGLDEARARETQKAIHSIMRDTPGLRQHTNYYVDPTMPPEQVTPRVFDMLRLDATLRARAKERFKKKKADAANEQQKLLMTPK